MSNDELQDANPDNELPADDLFDIAASDSAASDSAASDSADFDSAEFDSSELDPASVEAADSAQIGESESRDSEEVPVAGESESRESQEVPLANNEDGDEQDEEEEDAQMSTSENEWLLANFFSACGLYVALALVFFLDREVLTNPTKNMDWAFATIILPISFISFMSASLGLLSKPRGKQWLFLLPTLGPLVPIGMAVLSVIGLMNI